MPKLVVVNPEFGAQACELPDGKIAVGRAARNMLVISDSSVSSQHCELLVEGNEVIVRELGSRNGTFVNGVRVQTQSGALHGQIIRCGKIDLRLELDGQEESSDASTVTAVFMMRDPKKQADRARPPAASFHVTFAPVGVAIPESMTMFMPKVREEPAVPPLSIPELGGAPKKKSILVPIVVVLAIGVLVIALGRYLAGR